MFQNAAQIALIVKSSLANHGIHVLERPSYSPDVAPCDFFILSKVQVAWKEIRYYPVETIIHFLIFSLFFT